MEGRSRAAARDARRSRRLADQPRIASGPLHVGGKPAAAVPMRPARSRGAACGGWHHGGQCRQQPRPRWRLPGSHPDGRPNWRLGCRRARKPGGPVWRDHGRATRADCGSVRQSLAARLAAGPRQPHSPAGGRGRSCARRTNLRVQHANPRPPSRRTRNGSFPELVRTGICACRRGRRCRRRRVPRRARRASTHRDLRGTCPSGGGKRAVRSARPSRSPGPSGGSALSTWSPRRGDERSLRRHAHRSVTGLRVEARGSCWIRTSAD